MLKVDVFYDNLEVVVRRSIISDVESLSKNIRQCDIDEAWARGNIKAEKALKDSFNDSIFCLTIEFKENVVAMFGLIPDEVLGDKAQIWMIANDDFVKIGKIFLKNVKMFIDMMLSYYGYLYNWVDVRNKETIFWLKWAGAKFESPSPFGIEQLPFMYFYFKK